MSRRLQDVFFRKAKSSGYLARSAFKLLEIQEKFGVISPEGDVLDLGCHPGAWLQVSAKHTTGSILGIDLKECSSPPGCDSNQVTILKADATLLGSEERSHLAGGFQTVLSDMCHSTTGNAASDAVRSLELGRTAACLALGSSFLEDEDELQALGMGKASQGVLLSSGNLVIKLLEGAGIVEFGQSLRPCFGKLRHFRPQATRRESREVYLIGLKRHKGKRKL